jgi:MoxR-like ATPase
MPPKIIVSLVKVGFYTIMAGQSICPVMANPLPLAQDVPEEVLRAEIITEARSPIDGKALSATDFAELVVTTKQKLDLDDAELAASNSKFKETLLLLRLRSFLKSVGVPIK